MTKFLAALVVAFGVAGTAHALTILHPPGPAMAPEIDPAQALAAFSMLAGGLAVIRGRRQERSGVTWRFS